MADRQASLKEQHMQQLIQAALHAANRGDLPTAAMLLWDEDFMIDTNTVDSEQDATNHAEMNVMRKASDMKYRQLKHATLYSTIEPCAMCAAAAALNGITEIVFGAYDEKHGFVSSAHRGLKFEAFDLSYRGGVLGKECMQLLPKAWQEHVRYE